MGKPMLPKPINPIPRRLVLIQFGECLACDAEAVDGGGDTRVNGNGPHHLLAETFVEATQQRDIDRALLAA